MIKSVILERIMLPYFPEESKETINVYNGRIYIVILLKRF